MAINDTAITAPNLPMGWRSKVGIALLALMILLWLLIPIEAALKMSAGTIAATTTGLQSLTRLFGVEKAHERGRAMQETTYKGHLIKYHCSSDKWVAIVAFAKARSWAAS